MYKYRIELLTDDRQTVVVDRVTRAVLLGEHGLQIVERHRWHDGTTAEHRAFIPLAVVGDVLIQYNAANGHTMEYYAEFSDDGLPRLARGHSFDSWCADGCIACAEGDPLPDW